MWIAERNYVLSVELRRMNRLFYQKEDGVDLSTLQNREENAQYLLYIRCRLSSTRIIIVKHFLGEDCAER